MIAGLLLSGISLVGAALLRAGGASLLRTPRADALHDAADHVAGARRVAGLLDDRDVIIPAVNIVHSVLLVISAVSGTWAVGTEVSGPWLGAAVLVLGALVVAVGDLLPRRLGRSRPRQIAYRLSPLLAVGIGVGAKAADIIRNGGEDDEHDHDAHDEEDQEEIELISSVLEFSETIVREVMVPRPDMITVEAASSIADLLRLIDEHGFSRLPVIGADVDDVVGVVIAKDLLAHLAGESAPATVAEVMRPIDFVPETKRVSDLLREMQASKSHMAIVVDEYGGTAGLVTIEDVLEELVGEIVDEYDEEELLIAPTDDGGWLVDGRFAVSELSEIVESDLPDDEWDTVGGLVLGLAGRVPIEGESFEVDGVVLSVVRVQGRRVAEVSVNRTSGEGAFGGAG